MDEVAASELSNAYFSIWLEKEGWKWLWFYAACGLITLLLSHLGVPRQPLVFWTFGITFLYLPARLIYLVTRAWRMQIKEQRLAAAK